MITRWFPVLFFLQGATMYRDVWNHIDVPIKDGAFTVTLGVHDSLLAILNGTQRDALFTTTASPRAELN